MKKVKKSKLSAYILLDRSGSMGSQWVEAINSINGYVDVLKKNKNLLGNITIAAFDSGEWSVEGKQYDDFVVLRDNVPLSKFVKLKNDECFPRGMTPLYDATAKILGMALNNDAKKSVVVIMTDGEENMSKEFNLNQIKDKIKLVTEEKNWEVIFLGANFDAKAVTASYGLQSNKFVSSSTRNLLGTMQAYAEASANYTTLGSSIDLSDSLKQKASS